ncbi:MAG: hypothetical protein GYA87_08290 [Christensenellaceae bacterium]|nr:hypothetical protein [Christensenellaceae bacterium]
MKYFRFLIINVLIALAVFNVAFAEGDTDNVPGGVEIREWVQLMDSNARKTAPLNAPITEENKTEFGYEYQYSFATLYYSKPVLDEAQLLAVQVIDSKIPDPRGVLCFDSYITLLEKYPNDNPLLYGDYDMATLYVQNQMPDRAYWGSLMRNGQNITTIEYTIHETMPDNTYSDIKLSFNIEDNKVYSYGVFGLEEIVSLAEVEAGLQQVQKVMELKSYHGYFSSVDGTQLDMFVREDLYFSGIDFVELTPNDAIAKLGEPDTDNTMKNDDGKWYRTLNWSGVEITFLFDENQKFIRCDKITINDTNMEASRGIKVGDAFPSVFSKFRSGEGVLSDNMVEQLYGDSINAPYGIARYGENGISLTYAIDVSPSVENQYTVIMNLNFTNDYLNEIIYYTK